MYDSFDAIYAAASYRHDLGAVPRLDERTLDALARYKGTPPASLPFARHDLDRARQLEQLAATDPSVRLLPPRARSSPSPLAPALYAALPPSSPAARGGGYITSDGVPVHVKVIHRPASCATARRILGRYLDSSAPFTGAALAHTEPGASTAVSSRADP